MKTTLLRLDAPKTKIYKKGVRKIAAPLKRTIPYAHNGIVYDDGTYQIDKITNNGAETYTVMYKHKPALYNRVTLAEAQNDIGRLNKYYKGIDITRDYASGIQEGLEKGKWHGSPGSIHEYGDINTLVKSDTVIQGYDIDPEIRRAVYLLNYAGLKTMGSCAGHDKNDYGFITFARNDNEHLTDSEKNTIFNVLKQEGLQIKEFENPHADIIDGEDAWSNYSAVTFKPVGLNSG